MSRAEPLPPQEGEGSPPPAAPAGLPKPAQPWTALVLGGSGATGRILVAKLASNPRVTRIGALVRTELPLDYWGPLLPAHAAKIHQTVVDFEALDASADAFKGYSAAFSCLGSTRSKAGSKDAFFHQDFDYITSAAQHTRNGGVPHFSLMSSAGADPKSSFHYLRTKGLIEQHLMQKVQFPSLAIFRPGLLLTERPGESRWGEWIAQKVVPFFHPILPEKHCGVYTQTVAEAMMQQAEFALAQREQQPQQHQAEGAGDAQPAEEKPHSVIFENDEIRAMKVARM